MLEETAIHLAVTGSSYRQAAQSLEKLVGYACMSHETIRQLIVEAEVVGHRKMEKKGRVFFIEADGLYVKRQRSCMKRKRRENCDDSPRMGEKRQTSFFGEPTLTMFIKRMSQSGKPSRASWWKNMGMIH
ncbi:hypothetical protein LR68_02057 [Anoxybacillus sp. BCO1]|nr:hypothetical protein LR68_02057 [Anoxybacillus sp. BCO1]